MIFKITDNGQLAWGVDVNGDKNWIMGDQATLTLMYGIEFEIGRVPE